MGGIGSGRRWGAGAKTTCEEVKSIDVLTWHRLDRLKQGLYFSWAWTRGGEPSGDIRVLTEAGAIRLIYRIRQHGAQEWESVEQRVPIEWIPCRYGGRRPWFTCAIYANGRYCGRRVQKLYGVGKLFACRHCYGLAYASQQEPARERGLLSAQKIRRKLGGDGGPGEFLPKPKWMRWHTYWGLVESANNAEDRSTAGMFMWMRARLSRLKAVRS